MYKKIDLKETNYLEPYISDKTITYHYILYSNYLEKLNNVLLKNNFKFDYEKEKLFSRIDEFPIKDRDQIIYNLGGVVNHELYFTSMNVNSQASNKFEKIIIEEFGNMDNFKTKFISSANNLAGSGYTYLVINRQKKLEIVNFPNQDSPYLYDLIPILALDLWEHSYYLDYYNKRSEYIDNFFQIIDFNQVNNNYEKNIKLL